MSLDRRLRRFAAEHCLPEMQRAAPETDIKIEITNDVPPFEADPKAEVVPLALKLAGQNDTFAVCYATEASLFQLGGAPAAVIGPGRHRPSAQAQRVRPRLRAGAVPGRSHPRRRLGRGSASRNCLRDERPLIFRQLPPSTRQVGGRRFPGRMPAADDQRHRQDHIRLRIWLAVVRIFVEPGQTLLVLLYPGKQPATQVHRVVGERDAFLLVVAKLLATDARVACCSSVRRTNSPRHCILVVGVVRLLVRAAGGFARHRGAQLPFS